MIYNTIDGGIIEATALFVDENNNPIMPHSSYSGPIVSLKENTGELLFEESAMPSQTSPGLWEINVSVPEMDIYDTVDLILEWDMLTELNSRYRATDLVRVSPSRDRRVGDIVVLQGSSERIDVNIIESVDLDRTTNPDDILFDLYENNTPIYTGLSVRDPAVNYSVLSNKVTVSLPPVYGDAKLDAKLLYVTYKDGRHSLSRKHLFKVWVATPQMLVAMSLVEDFINKARLENVIPSLEYTPGDLMMYLHRGLNLFNGYPPVITNFNGKNMQGALLDTWVTCSCYYALAAQLQAEGALAFDFSGQVVNLNIDRTPSIEAALGRIESRIDDTVKPYKKLLAKVGVKGGDGHQGNNVSFTPNIGTLSVTNSPTTRRSVGSGISRVNARPYNPF